MQSVCHSNEFAEHKNKLCHPSHHYHHRFCHVFFPLSSHLILVPRKVVSESSVSALFYKKDPSTVPCWSPRCWGWKWKKKNHIFRQKLAFTDGAASLLRERNWELCPNLENNGKILLGHFDKWKNQHLNLFQIMSWREWTFSLHGQLGVPEGVRFILLHSALYCCVCMAHCDAAGLFMSKNKYSEYIHTHLTRLCKVNTAAFVFQRCLLVRCLLAFCCLPRLSWPHRLCSAPRTIRFFRLLLSHLQLILSSAHHFVQFTAPSVLSQLLKLSCHKLFAYLLPCTKNHPWSYHFVLSGFMGICRAHTAHIIHSYTLTI